MKKILFLLVCLLLASCDPEKDIPEIEDSTKGQFDPNAMIIIRPAKGVQLRSTVSNLTALQIVEQAVNIKWQSHYFNNAYFETEKDIARSFNPNQKDYQIPAIKMFGIDVISGEGEYYRDFTYAFNVVITDTNNDTIAFVPDSVINIARPIIETAFADSNYTEVYRIFEEAFTFLPIE